MALITLKNGKTIDIDLWTYLNMTDDELQDLEALNVGFDVQNPFHSSALNQGWKQAEEAEDEEEEETLPLDAIDDTDLLERDDI